MPSDGELLRFHRGARNGIRAVLEGLDEERLHEKDSVRGYSIAEEVGHLVAAEHWFLADDLGLDPGFPRMDRRLGQDATGGELAERLRLIESRWPELLRQHPDKSELRVVLARMAMHTLYHLPKIVDLRIRMEPDFGLPHHSEPGSWEQAIDPLLESI
jgi:uncharacterized damage-inducible protein DinB